jgi:hypothetical protein
MENRKNELAIANERLDNLNKLINNPLTDSIPGCLAERRAKGWSVLSGANVVSGGTGTFTGKDVYGISGTEKNIFCDAPLKGGFDHESFIHKNDETGHGILGGIIGGLTLGPYGAIYGAIAGSVSGGKDGIVTHPDVPYINANRVFKFDKAFGSGHTDIEMSCNFIYKSSVLDYKKSIPGVTNIVEPYIEPVPDTNNGIEGNCTDPTTEVVHKNMIQVDCIEAGGMWEQTSSTTTPTTPTSQTNTSSTNENGRCGKSNGGTFASAPGSYLCSFGNASPVTGSGPWNWTCNSTSGPDPASCSANRQQ